MARPALSALIAAASLAVAIGAQAQPAPAATPVAKASSPPADVSIADSYIDFSIPDVAALGLFGVNPSKVTRPGNLKEFSLAVLPLAAGGTSIGGGVAMSWAPVYTFAHSVDAYQHGLARRLAFSLATTKDSKTSAVTVAAGARIVLRDDSDPLASDDFHAEVLKLLWASLGAAQARDHFQGQNPDALDLYHEVARQMTSDPATQAGVIDAFAKVWDITAPPAEAAAANGTSAETHPAIEAQVKRVQDFLDAQAKGDSTLTRIDLKKHAKLNRMVRSLAVKYIAAVEAVDVAPASIKTKLAKARQDFLDRNWNATVATIDIGTLSSSTSGTWGDLKGQKVGAAFMFTHSAGDSAEFVAQVQARKGVGSTPDETSFYSGGGRFLIGGATKRFSIEGLISKANDLDPQKNGVAKRATVGTEIRVSDGLWIELAVGSEWTPANANSGSRLLSLANLKYAFNTKPRFDQIPGAVPDSQ